MTERAVLAGGCFWGMQDLIRRMPGVISTRVGYTGGDVSNATYRNHGTHAEGIEIVFDPSIISYRQLLELFFQIHDPTTPNRQGNDIGPSYRSAIYYLDDRQRQVARDTIEDVEASGLWPGRVVTELDPMGDFWKPSPNIRTIWNGFRTAIPATSRARTGCYPDGVPPNRRRDLKGATTRRVASSGSEDQGAAKQASRLFLRPAMAPPSNAAPAANGAHGGAGPDRSDAVAGSSGSVVPFITRR